jgi:Fe-S-cluster containining protein
VAVILEGVGDDWLITRQPGGAVRLHTFSSPSEIPALFRRLLAGEAPKAARPAVTKPINGARNGTRPPRNRLAIAKPVPVVPQCRDCGACCAPASPSSRHYVGLEQPDVDRLSVEERLSLVVTDAGRGSLATKKGSSGRRVCASFEGTLGGSCSCAIYDRRPDACRTFERGSEDCARARSLVGVGSTV